MNNDFFHIQIEQLKEHKIFPFHLYIYNPNNEEYALFLFANTPLSPEKEQMLKFFISRKGEISINLKQKKTCISFLKILEDNLHTSFEERNAESLLLKQKKALKRKKLLLDKAELNTKKELEIAFSSHNFFRMIKITKLFVTSFDLTISKTLSLANQLGHDFLNIDNKTNRLVALSFFLAKRAGIVDQKELGNVIVGSFLIHIGHTQLHPHFSNLKHINFDLPAKRKYKQHMGLACSLINKGKIQLDLPIIQIINQHHEKFNGHGYPGYKKAEAINTSALIIHLADEILNSICPKKHILNNFLSIYKRDELISSFGEKLVDLLLHNSLKEQDAA